MTSINNYTLLRLLGETGIDISRFETKKQFVIWCGLSPRQNQSGNSSKYVKRAPCNKARQIFKEVAQSLKNSKYSNRAFYKKYKLRKAAVIAYKVGARNNVENFYDSITKASENVEYGIKNMKNKRNKKN